VTNEQFLVGWKRLTTLLEITNKQEENLDLVMAEYLREYGNSSAEFWDKCVSRIINEPSRRFFPSLGEMAAVAEQIRDTRRQVGCDRCEGTGFVLQDVNGVKAVSPCHCRQKPSSEPRRSRSGGLKPVKEVKAG